MEAFHKEANTFRGTEVLYFENAELTKFKGDKNSFAAFGPLSVLYFKDFKRFVLQLNDWKYPLFRRVPISKEGSQSSPSYLLPGLGDSSYRLTLSQLPNTEGLANFETILNHNTNFSANGEENTLRRLEASPDDKLVRHTGPIHKEAGLKATISEALKTATDKVKATAGSFKGSKGLPKKKRSNLKDIKARDFKNEAKSTFKKNYFEATGKLSQEFLNRRKDNINLSQVREFNDLRKTADNAAASFFIRKEELEGAILNIKDLITERSYTMDPLEKKGLMQNLRSGIHGIKDSITGVLGGHKNEEGLDSTQASERRTEGSISQNRPSREVISVHDKVEKVPAPEGMSHYQA